MQDQVEGQAKEAMGGFEDAAGTLAGDPKTRAKGKLLQAKGAVQRTLGQTRDRALDIAAQAKGRGQDLYVSGREQATDRPLAAIGAALGAAVVLGLVLGAARSLRA